MVISAASAITLDPYPALLPLPEAGTRAASFFDQHPELLPIPETANREASALNLLPPVAAGVTPGGVSTGRFNQGQAFVAADAFLELTGNAITVPNFPTYPAPILAPAARDSVDQAAESTPPPTAAQAVPAASAPTVAQSDTAAFPIVPLSPSTDLLPALLALAYRAPLASSLMPLAWIQGPTLSREASPLQVDATLAITPLGAEASHYAFNPNDPARDRFRPGAAAYQAQGVVSPEAAAPSVGPPHVNVQG